MATPTLAALRAGFPGAELVGLARPVVQQVLHSPLGHPAHIDQWILFHKKWLRRSATAASRLGLIRQLRRERLDAVLLLTNSLWTAAVVKAARVPTIVGYARDGRGVLLTDRLQPPREGRRYQPISAVDYYLELARWLGCDAEDKRMRLSVDTASQSDASRLWEELQLDPQRPTVVINNNAANQAARMWPDGHVQHLAKQLVEQGNVQVLLHCGPGECERANSTAATLGHPRVVSMGHRRQLPIGLSKAVLARAAVVVSTDSGARHMAVALDRPVVSLFGPTSPAWTRTYNRPEQMLAVPMDCRTCYRSTCPLGHGRCMRDVSPQDVLRATLFALRQHARAELPVVQPWAA